MSTEIDVTFTGLLSGLGDSATRDVGTTSGTVAAGDDSRFTDAADHIADASNPHSVTAAQAGAVATSGDETIAGVKTFSSSPIVPTPTTDYQAATKKYADEMILSAPQSNILINGNFAVWQRGTSSAAITTTRTYLADRFAVKTGAGTLSSVACSTTVPSGSRSRYSLELTGATGVTTVTVDQRIEAANVPKSTVYFSAYVYNGSGSAFTPMLYVSTPSASDTWTTPTVINGSGSGESLQECADSAWTKVYWTTDISGYSNIDNGVEFKIEIPSGSLVSGDTVYFADLVLTYGSSYVEPLVKNEGEIFRDCARYYFAAGGNSVYEIFATGQCNSTTVAVFYYSLPVKMRANASVSMSSASHFGVSTATPGGIVVSSIGSNPSDKTPSINAITVSAGLVAGNGAYLFAYNTTSARLYFNAEL